MALVNYDIDDWEMPGHQRRAILQPIQIDEMEAFEGRARSYVDPDAEFDFRYWEERELTLSQAQFRYRTDAIREARRTVDTFTRRTFISKSSKNYIREFAKFQRSVEMLEEDGQNMIEYKKMIEEAQRLEADTKDKRLARILKKQKKAEALEAIKKSYKIQRLSNNKTYGQHLEEVAQAKAFLKKETK